MPSDELGEYLERKGVVELFCEIDPAGSQFAHLADELGLSRTTLSKRLQEGEELGLLETVEAEGRGTSHAYVLSEAGAEIRVYLNQRGMTEKHRQLKRLREEFDTQCNEVLSWVARREDDLGKPLQSDGFRQHLREYSTFEQE